MGAKPPPIQSQACRLLSSGIKRAVGTGTMGMGSKPLLFCTFGRKSPDPLWVVLIRRVKRVRIAWHRSAQQAAQLDGVLWNLVAIEAPGACRGDEPPPFPR